MSDLYDVCLYLNRNGILKKITWKNLQLQQKYEGLWKHHQGGCLEENSDFRFDRENRFMYWRSLRFCFEKEELDNGNMLLILKSATGREQLYQGVLDTLDESIQIYDEDADIVYINRVGREIIGMEENPEGKNLLDVFDVAEDESTTMEALRMKAPVKNRFKHYFSKQGKELFTVNSAFPVFSEGEVLGALALEESISVIARKAEQLEKLQEAVREKVADATARRRSVGYSFKDLTGNDPGIRKLRELAARVARQESNVLIVGETGTGKEILAQSIHRGSSRKKGPFIALNCAAIPESLIESILFGTAKGAFTGSADKAGLLEEADKGSLFLDELNSMSISMQAKVLRALQEGTFRRVGGNKECRTDARVISSCNEDPFVLMEQKKMRSDLFYRLASVILEIPPLRERIGDLEELIWHHIGQIQATYAFPFREIEPAVLWQLQHYSWPGNVRELFHVVDYAMNIASDDCFRCEYLPSYCTGKRDTLTAGDCLYQPAVLSGPLPEQVELFEAGLIEKTLRFCGGNISETARKLGLQRQSLQYRLRKYGIRT